MKPMLAVEADLSKIKYQAIGVKDKPRFPSFLGWRDTDDL